MMKFRGICLFELCAGDDSWLEQVLSQCFVQLTELDLFLVPKIELGHLESGRQVQ